MTQHIVLYTYDIVALIRYIPNMHACIVSDSQKGRCVYTKSGVLGYPLVVRCTHQIYMQSLLSSKKKRMLKVLTAYGLLQ